MLPSESSSQIDINRIIAYMAIDTAKGAIASIMGRLGASGDKAGDTQVDATVEIGRLRPWKKFEGSVLVILKAYPGLVSVLQDDNLRERLLLHDTGVGLLFARPEIRGYLDVARISGVSDTIRDVKSAVDMVDRGFFVGSYGDSVRWLFNTVRPSLDRDLSELIEFHFDYLQKRIDDKGIREFVDLQIPILGYEDRLTEIFREIAFVCERTVNLLVRFVSKVDPDHLARHAESIAGTKWAVDSSLGMLKGLCDKYAQTESHRFNTAASSLRKL